MPRSPSPSSARCPNRVGLWPSVLLQSSMSFSNLAVPVAADAAMQVRFLQKQGLDLASAVATGGVLSSVSEIVCQLGLLFIAIWLAPDKIDFGNIDTDQILAIGLIALFVLGVVLAVVFSIRRIRRVVVPAVDARRANRVGCGEDTGKACTHRRRQHHRAVLLRPIAARLPRGVRPERQLLDVARAQHRHRA